MRERAVHAFVRSGCSWLWKPSACAVFTSCCTCMQDGRYVLMCFVSLLLHCYRPVPHLLHRSPVASSLGAGRARYYVVRTCSLYRIGLKVSISFAHERLSCMRRVYVRGCHRSVHIHTLR